MNLNQAAYSKADGEYLAEVLERAVVNVFSQGDIVAFASPNHQWNRNFIGHNLLQINIEIGPKMSRVHAHVIQEIKHRSIINIDQQDARDALNDVISEMTGGRVEKCFVTKKVHPSVKPLEEYVDKDNYDWKHSGLVPRRNVVYTLQSGGEASREEIEDEEDAEIAAAAEALWGLGHIDNALFNEPEFNLINWEEPDPVLPPKTFRILPPTKLPVYKPVPEAPKKAFKAGKLSGPPVITRKQLKRLGLLSQLTR